jgi:2-iminobutanoate/2-iminopropanoate deaminase
MGSRNKPVGTDKAASPVGPYSQGMDTGRLVFVSGQIGVEPGSGEFAGPDLESQARQALANVREILAAAGLTLEDVSAVDVFLTNMGDFAAFNTIYAEFFGDHKPARAAVEVSALPKGGLVEVKCVAVRP